MNVLSLIGIVGWLWAFPAQASYRVYQLKVTEYDRAGRKLFARLELSSLDHVQWEHIHNGYGTAKVEFLDTWYCPGDTSRRHYCPKPKNVKTRGPASTLEKRNAIPFNRQPVIP